MICGTAARGKVRVRINDWSLWGEKIRSGVA